jgi:hypothetical protein
MLARALRITLRRLAVWRWTGRTAAWIAPASIMRRLTLWRRALRGAPVMRNRGTAGTGRRRRRPAWLLFVVRVDDLLPGHRRDRGPSRRGRAITLIVVAAHGHLPNKTIETGAASGPV